MPRFQRLAPTRPPIGALRHRLTLEAPVDAPDAAGGATRTWNVVATLWAAIEPFVSDANFRALRPEQTTTHRITMRWRGDIDGAKRLRLGARVFAVIATADADERRRRLVCLCEEVKP
jgi:SPP1 family predicted phage head-tail adaptor